MYICQSVLSRGVRLANLSAAGACCLQYDLDALMEKHFLWRARQDAQVYGDWNRVKSLERQMIGGIIGKADVVIATCITAG